MSFDETFCNPANINSSNPANRPIPPITPPRSYCLRGGQLITVRNAIRIDPDRPDRILCPEEQPEGNEHYYLAKQLCKTGRFTKAFDGIQFSRMEFYQRSLIRVAVLEGRKGGRDGDGIIGFSNFWHKIKTPITKLYFVVTDPLWYRMGVSEALMDDLYSVCEHKALELDVNVTNPEAVRLYEKHGFEHTGYSLNGTCHYMTRLWGSDEEANKRFRSELVSALDRKNHLARLRAEKRKAA